MIASPKSAPKYFKDLWEIQGSVKRIDCIVTDFTLPDMSSFELLSDVNPAEGVSAMAMIILARYAIPALADLARRNGIQAFLMKRLTSGEDLTSVIQNAIASVRSRKNHSSES